MRSEAKPVQSQLVRRGRGVSNEIFSLLLNEITSKGLPAGARLQSERELAEHFGVSQPTVREALRALDAIGLVDVRHGSGAYVTGDVTTLLNLALSTLVQLESVSILDLLEIKSALAAYSAKRAARFVTNADIEEARLIADRLADTSRLNSVDEIAQAVVDFQVVVSRASHSPFLNALETFIFNLMMELQLAARPRTVASWRRFTGAFIKDRAEVITALSARDEQSLVLAMAAYTDHLHEVFAEDSGLNAARLSPTRAIVSEHAG